MKNNNKFYIIGFLLISSLFICVLGWAYPFNKYFGRNSFDVGPYYTTEFGIGNTTIQPGQKTLQDDAGHFLQDDAQHYLKAE